MRLLSQDHNLSVLEKITIEALNNLNSELGCTWLKFKAEGILLIRVYFFPKPLF